VDALEAAATLEPSSARLRRGPSASVFTSPSRWYTSQVHHRGFDAATRTPLNSSLRFEREDDAYVRAASPPRVVVRNGASPRTVRRRAIHDAVAAVASHTGGVLPLQFGHEAVAASAASPSRSELLSSMAANRLQGAVQQRITSAGATPVHSSASVPLRGGVDVFVRVDGPSTTQSPRHQRAERRHHDALVNSRLFMAALAKPRDHDRSPPVPAPPPQLVRVEHPVPFDLAVDYSGFDVRTGVPQDHVCVCNACRCFCFCRRVPAPLGYPHSSSRCRDGLPCIVVRRVTARYHHPALP
jgi:hypothetical protein